MFLYLYSHCLGTPYWNKYLIEDTIKFTVNTNRLFLYSMNAFTSCQKKKKKKITKVIYYIILCSSRMMRGVRIMNIIFCSSSYNSREYSCNWRRIMNLSFELISFYGLLLHESNRLLLNIIISISYYRVIFQTSTRICWTAVHFIHTISLWLSTLYTATLFINNNL